LRDQYYYALIGDVSGVQKLIIDQSTTEDNVLYLSDRYGRTCFYLSARAGHQHFIKYLLNLGKPEKLME
jgi:ankyrin repeat protein